MSAMAVSASSSVCGVNSGLILREAPSPAGLSTSSVKCVAFAARSRFGSGFSVVNGRRRISQRVLVLASASDDVNSTELKGKSVKTEESVPAWAQPGTDELPPWAKTERPPTQEPTQDAPFFVYLIGSSLVAIAAVGSVFEYFNKNPVFGVVQPDNPLWAPILGFFAFTGIPTAGFLFYKSIKLANKASEDIDREDGVSDR